MEQLFRMPIKGRFNNQHSIEHFNIFSYFLQDVQISSLFYFQCLFSKLSCFNNSISSQILQ